jgi:hypothetical protein
VDIPRQSALTIRHLLSQGDSVKCVFWSREGPASLRYWRAGRHMMQLANAEAIFCMPSGVVEHEKDVSITSPVAIAAERRPLPATQCIW